MFRHILLNEFFQLGGKKSAHFRMRKTDLSGTGGTGGAFTFSVFGRERKIFIRRILPLAGVVIKGMIGARSAEIGRQTMRFHVRMKFFIQKEVLS